MSQNNHWADRRKSAVAPGVGQFHPASTAVSASGALITDADGRELIDFAGGIGVQNVGHCDPQVVKAVQEQAARLMHTCFHVAMYEPYLALCEKLASMFPHGGKSKVLLVNTGAEAVENSIKIARQATGRQGVICFTESFHGRTMMAMSLTSKVGYKVGCGPFAPEVYRLPYPNRWKYGDGLSESAFVARELRRFREALVNTVHPEQAACVIIECVQGEGGFVNAPFAYLRGLRDLCDQAGIMLILDEVQTGFCRTGKWASYQHAGIEPDISTWAKSLGAGLPIAAVIGKAAVMDKTRPGTLGGTYGGNPVSCAAALAAIRVMEEKDLNARAEQIGRTIRARFERLHEQFPHVIADVRGLGAMIAMELCIDGDPSKPATEFVADVMRMCLARGLLLCTAGAAANIVRVLCPLVISGEQLERGLAILEEATAERAGAEQRGVVGSRHIPTVAGSRG